MSVCAQSERGLGRLCGLLGQTRQAYYKRIKVRECMALSGDLIIQEVLGLRKRQKRLGGRKLYHLLKEFFEDHSISIGRDGFFDLLRAHLLLVRRRVRKPRTTHSYWGGRKYPNLAKDMVPWKSNQLWVSDITYIRLREGFCYLSLVTDAYSRKIVGFYLSEDLGAGGCVRALSMALETNPEREGLIHHSDRGAQYYSAAYIRLLGDTRISMTENSDPLENAIAERVNGILKQELLKRRYSNIFEAEKAVAEAISIYNDERPHSSIDMLTPAEAHDRVGELKRRWKNYFRPEALQAAA